MYPSATGARSAAPSFRRTAIRVLQAGRERCSNTSCLSCSSRSFAAAYCTRARASASTRRRNAPLPASPGVFPKARSIPLTQGSTTATRLTAAPLSLCAEVMMTIWSYLRTPRFLRSLRTRAAASGILQSLNVSALTAASALLRRSTLLPPAAAKKTASRCAVIWRTMSA